MTAYCPHGEDVNVECGPCERAAEQGHAPRPPRTVRMFRARWSSNCPSCQCLILPGDEVASLPEGSGGGIGCADCVRTLS